MEMDGHDFSLYGETGHIAIKALADRACKSALRALFLPDMRNHSRCPENLI
jgi:hypothetical protein